MILLDTHVVICLAFTPDKISRPAADTIRKAEFFREVMGISAITLYEIVRAIRRGRIEPSVPEQIFIDRIRNRFKVLPVSDSIAVCAAQLLAPFHGDPMDRIIAATAIVEDCVLITQDDRIRQAKVCKVVW